MAKMYDSGHGKNMEEDINISEIKNNEFRLPAIDNNLHLLPRNWNSDKIADYEYSENIITVKKLLINNNLSVTIDGFSTDSSLISNRNFEWMGPIIFVSYSLFTQNEHIISITLNIISNYLTDSIIIKWILNYT
jgi:hypothetical protein